MIDNDGSYTHTHTHTHTHQERLLLPDEMLSLMGMGPKACRFRRLIASGELSAASVRAMAGNGLHCSAVASVFVWGVLNFEV